MMGIGFVLLATSCGEGGGVLEVEADPEQQESRPPASEDSQLPGDSAGADSDGLPLPEGEGLTICELSPRSEGVLDEEGEESDWIELCNLGQERQSLQGWSLTNREGLWSQWVLPAVELDPGETLLIFASGKDRRDPAAPLHSNFKLSAGGEYLALLGPETPATLATELRYPALEEGQTLGLHEAPGYWVLDAPTPDQSNLSAAATGEALAGIRWSHPGGVLPWGQTVRLGVLEGREGLELRCAQGRRASPEDDLCPEELTLDAVQRWGVVLVRDGAVLAETQRSFLPAREELSFRSGLPLVVVDAFGHPTLGSSERRDFVDAHFSLLPPQAGSLSQRPLLEARGGIRVRGNSTRGYEKKQFALEFWDLEDEDRSLPVLNFPSEADWILHAPYSDKSLMRNHLMYTLSRDLGRYASRTQPVELFLDFEGDGLDAEDYWGVYILMEKIEVGEDRVAVEELDPGETDSASLPGGYLMKKDWIEGDSVVVRTDRFRDQVIIVDPDQPASEQLAWVEDYLNGLEAALLSSAPADPASGYPAWIDPGCFADHQLMVELGRNVDGYVLSTYLHKDREGLLCMGPIWDYNGALGNADSFQAWNPQGWHYDNPEFPADNPNAFRWYEELLEDSAYLQLYTDRWARLREGPLSDEAILGRIETMEAQLQDAADRNFERWPVLGEYVWPNDSGYRDRVTYAQEVDYLREWLLARLSWMDSALADGQP